MTEDPVITCQELERALDAYRRGALTDAQAGRLEWHAAHCERCERLLGDATNAHRLVAEFAPALPPMLREATLRQIREQPRESAKNQRATRRWWVATGTMLAAAAVVAIIVSSRDAGAPLPRNTAIVSSSDSVPGDVESSRGFPDVAEQLATAEAQPEFAALDVAATELEQALAQTPGDRELAAYLAAVRARRDELERRVRDAKS